MTFDNLPENTGVVIGEKRMSFDKVLSPFLSPIHVTTCSNEEDCKCQIWHCCNCDGIFKADVEDKPKCYFCNSETEVIKH